MGYCLENRNSVLEQNFYNKFDAKKNLKIMPTVHLKTSETVQVRLEDLAPYLNDNRENIQVRRIERRGAVRK